jgi:hypothetical protein
MVQQWLRKMSLIAAPSETATGIELSELQVHFDVSAQVTDTPSTLNARIYNVSPSTTHKLQLMKTAPEGDAASPEMARVALRAGYEGNFGLIFKGELRQVRSGRQGTETFVDLLAADGDWGHNWGVLNTTLAAGFKPSDINDQIKESLSAYGVNVNDLPEGVPQQGAPRGKVLYGMTRDVRRDLANTYELDHYISNGTLEWVPSSAYKQGERVKVNSTTGMIGLPTQTNYGLTVTMLLNPSVGANTLLEINNASVQRQQFTTNVNQLQANIDLSGNLSIPDTNNDGIYKVLAVTHTGDTRGNEWYTTAICIALFPSGPVASVPTQYLNYGISP